MFHQLRQVGRGLAALRQQQGSYRGKAGIRCDTSNKCNMISDKKTRDWHLYLVTGLFTLLEKSSLWVDPTQYRACGIGHDRAGDIEHGCNLHVTSRQWSS